MEDVCTWTRQERRPKWPYKSMSEVHTAVNDLMRRILVNERSKRWGQVVEAYDRLLWIIERKHFPADYEPPTSYFNLLYECHFHLGLALQRLGHHKQSIVHYTKAIDAVSIPKGGCQAGCISNACMLTPLFARRAFAYCKSGNVSKALKDVEALTLLDSKNADVYCVRALVRAARKEEKQAVQDLDCGLSLNPQHGGCLVVKRALLNPTSVKSGPEVLSVDNVNGFLHPFASDFYDSKLYTLLVPHKQTVVNLTPDKPSEKQMGRILESEIQRSGSANSIRTLSPGDPFRCGMVTPGCNVLAAKRRKDYGEAVRKNVSRPQTAQEFLERLRRDIKRRCYSSPTESHAHSSAGHTPSFITWTTRSAHSKFTFETPTTYSIPVFQRINVKSAPRMYFRPWQGDRLPVADVPHPKPAPAFY